MADTSDNPFSRPENHEYLKLVAMVETTFKEFGVEQKDTSQYIIRVALQQYLYDAVRGWIEKQLSKKMDEVCFGAWGHYHPDRPIEDSVDQNNSQAVGHPQ